MRYSSRGFDFALAMAAAMLAFSLGHVLGNPDAHVFPYGAAMLVGAFVMARKRAY